MSNNDNNFQDQVLDNTNNQEELSKQKPEGNFEDLLKKINELQQQVGGLQEQSDKYKENYMRSIADFDNYRRRMAREIEEIRKNASFSIIEDLLPILDNLTLGIEAAKKEENSITLQGFQVILEQFKAVLTSYGLQEINPQGASFDHNEHQCVSMIADNEVQENDIISVVRLGYRLNNRLLRPASVIVSSGKTDNSQIQDL